jgi:hypothetical protein
VRKGIAAVLIAAALVGCTEPTITDTPVDEREPSGTSAGTGSSVPSPAEQAAELGDTIKLHGMNDGIAIDVTPSDLRTGAEDGLYRIDFRLENTGTVVYSDSFGNGALLVSADGRECGWWITGGASELGSPRIAPGDFRVGALAFKCPRGSDEPASLQVTLDSGFGPETGQWSIG